jgi:integrase/recombinase XerD
MHGERVRRSAQTYQEALKMLETMQAAAERHTGWAPLYTVLDAYLAHVRVRRKANTARSAEYHAKWLLSGLGADTNVNELRPVTVDRFIDARRARGAPVSTVNAHLRILRAACRHAVEAGLLTAAPSVKLLRETRTLPTVLDAGELERLLAQAGPEVRLAVALAANAGLRHAEILHLRAEDVDLAQGLLYVRAKEWPGGGAWSPKAHAERIVPLNTALRAALELAPTKGWLFPGREDGPRVGLYAEVREAFRAAGLYANRPGLHKLRRTFASRLLAGGADVNTVRELGGWADLVTTQRYLVSSDASKRRAVELLNDDA